jgi:cytochrome b6-f complex iron-sulfur subunit
VRPADLDGSGGPGCAADRRRPARITRNGSRTAEAGRCDHRRSAGRREPGSRREYPCHGSRFASDGTLLSPPARSDVSSFPASLEANGDVVVQLFAGDGTFKNPVVGGQFSFAIADFPALRDVGGAIAGRPDGFPTPLIVSRLTSAMDASALGALSAICTHLGCTVLPLPGAQLLCPCHGSTFALDGTVTNGPATIALGRYGVSFDGITVVVSTVAVGRR